MAEQARKLSESDLELLETYLDGELPVAEAEGLWRRLEAEAGLKAALDELRGERAGRLLVWDAMEPSDAETIALSRSVGGAVRRRKLRQWANRGVAYVTAAAACLVVGFRVGWMSHVATIAPVAEVPATPSQYQVAIRDAGGNVVAEPRFNTQQEAVDFVNDLSRSQTSGDTREPGTNIAPASYEQY